MELKRLLTRANALLLQGAYHGAESFIEQAMAESDKIKSELAELDTLRTRATEMAAEIERLQSVIDEANAQEPYGWDNAGDLIFDLDAGINGVESTPLFAAPVPAQQSPAVAVPDGWKLVPIDPTPEMQSAALRLVERQHQTRDVYREMLFSSPNTASSPRITEQDAREIIENFCYEYNSCAGIDEWCEKEGRALLNKLNGDKNGK